MNFSFIASFLARDPWTRVPSVAMRTVVQNLAAKVCRPFLPQSYTHALVTEAGLYDGGSVGWLAVKDITRFHWLVDTALAGITLSVLETTVVIDACRGWWISGSENPEHVLGLWMEVDEALALNEDVGNWGLDKVDGARLVAKLRALSPLETLSLLVAIERFWALPQEDDYTARLTAAGFVRPTKIGRAA